MVLSTPVFKALREKFPNAYIAAMVLPKTKAIVEGNPYLDEVIVYDKEGSEKTWWETARFALRLGQRKFDVVVNLHATNRVHWVSFLAGIPERMGYQRKCGFLLTRKIPDLKKQGLKHESEYNFDLLRLLEVPQPTHLELYFPLKDPDREKTVTALSERGLNYWTDLYVVMNPSASCRSKVWRPERFAQVGDLLLEKYGFKVVLIGAAEDAAHSQNVSSAMRSTALNLTGRLSLGMLAWLLKGSRLVISNDSGPVHIAASVGTPVISIFGRNQAGLSPRRWGPLTEKGRVLQRDVGCVICLAHNCQIEFRCLEAVQVEDVLAGVAELERYFLDVERSFL